MQGDGFASELGGIMEVAMHMALRINTGQVFDLTWV